MGNLERLKDIFVDVFNVAKIDLGTAFNSQNVDGWDSVRQLALTSSIEDVFDIMLDPEDIIGCNSYEHAVEILKKNGIPV